MKLKVLKGCCSLPMLPAGDYFMNELKLLSHTQTLAKS